MFKYANLFLTKNVEFIGEKEKMLYICNGNEDEAAWMRLIVFGDIFRDTDGEIVDGI